MAGKLDVIVATNAFGMGVDKSDIRLVVHADIPRSPEAYYQEAGRGGRDGKPTRCVLLFNHGDIRLQEFLIDASYPRRRDAARAVEAVARPARARLADARATTTSSRRGSKKALGTDIVERGDRARRCASSSATACCAATTSGIGATRPDPGTFPPLDVESLQRRADVERCEAAHDGRVRVLHALPAPVRARVLRRRRTGRTASARAARATPARRSRMAGRSGSATRSSRRSATCCCWSAHSTGGSAARRSRRSPTAPKMMRGSRSCPSGAACAAGATSS